MTDGLRYFLDHVLPTHPQADAFFVKYPHVSLLPTAHSQPLTQIPVLMLVALTGTGKSTTLNLLTEMRDSGELRFVDAIPSRREIADFIVIPTAQTLLGESIQPESDRVRRFYYTRTFAGHFSGGIAQAFSWLQLEHPSGETIISEGVRGEAEITYALKNCPRWRVIELTVNTLTRLKRLSSRDDKFDQAQGSVDVSFLPENVQAEALGALNSGDISPQALTILRAEAENYDLTPANLSHERYQLIRTDDRSPQEVAAQVALTVQEMMSYA